VSTFESVGAGWDCDTYLANGEWILQFPRLPGSEDRLSRQIAVLEGLQGELSAAVPEPELVSLDPLCMGYRRIAGVAASDNADDGIWPERLGRFLYDLHLVPPEFAGMRAAGPGGWRHRTAVVLGDFWGRVFPLLSQDERTVADGWFAAFLDDDANFRFATGVVHADIGPEHVLLTDEGDLAGVIDWGDACVGDPAIDFAWLLHGAAAAGERALASYGGPPDERFRFRAGVYDRLGPWHEVAYGLDTEQAVFVESGLDGVRARLAGRRNGPRGGTMERDRPDEGGRP
jgi:aminoglycoside phosphotransferase (APT) family kinase protein